jgi:alkanesulfonate monooxygenase
VLKQRLDTLKRHCDDIGRSYDTIEKTLTAGAFFDDDMKSADDILVFCEKMARLGFQHIFFHMPAAETLKPLELFAEKIIPVVSELQPA